MIFLINYELAQNCAVSYGASSWFWRMENNKHQKKLTQFVARYPYMGYHQSYRESVNTKSSHLLIGRSGMGLLKNHLDAQCSPIRYTHSLNWNSWTSQFALLLHMAKQMMVFLCVCYLSYQLPVYFINVHSILHALTEYNTSKKYIIFIIYRKS